ncbi:MAG: class A beta-lactamase-related serine hydrolase [Deltaproteobacteria bacterium]|nr:MAG: class A beta-lactamase-related serine hydrolase [Deltaproteobacteria bacterium]
MVVTARAVAHDAGVKNVHGEVAPGFERVATVFEENFRARGEVGASVCVFHRGRKVVDLWGGYADKRTKRPWERDTVSVLFSSTKGLAATTALLLARAGQLDYDAPVARYWPEFARHGKGDITVRTLLNHRAGLSAVDRRMSLDDLESPDRLARILEAQAPMWTPGSAQGYGAIAWGLYVGELVRRVTGERLGRAFADLVARPLGLADDLWIGTPEHAERRVARLYPADTWTRLTKIVPRLVTGRTHEGRVYRAVAKGRTPTARALLNPPALGPAGIRAYDSRRVRAMDLPFGGGVGHARGLATVYAALLGVGGPDLPTLAPEEAVTPLYARQSWTELDRVLLKPLGFSQGFIKDELHLFSPNPEAFGHPGAGGALGWADPVAGVAIGYVMNAMDFRIRSPRALALAHAVQEAATGRPWRRAEAGDRGQG